MNILFFNKIKNLDNWQNLKAILEIANIVLRLFYRLLGLLVKTKSNRICFISYRGQKGYRCNPKYVTEYLLKEHSNIPMDIIWFCKDKIDCNYLTSKGIRIIHNIYSIQGVKALLTSSVIVENGIPVHYFVRKNNQICIDTWHGGGCYKINGIDIGFINIFTKKAIEYATSQITHFVSSCKMFSDLAIRHSFKYNGEILEIGLPRNDVLLNHNINSYAIKKRLNIANDCKVILYAPTYRDGKSSINSPSDTNLNVANLVDCCQKKWGGNWVVLTRSHIHQDANVDLKTVDVTDYNDSQELLAITDVLISDYSSIIWDYSLLEKPCFLFCPDIDNYSDTRNFYKKIEEWHFPIARSNNELQYLIENFEETSFLASIKLHHNEFGSFEKGRSCQIISKIIIDHFQRKTSSN